MGYLKVTLACLAAVYALVAVGMWDPFWLTFAITKWGLRILGWAGAATLVVCFPAFLFTYGEK